MGVTTNEIGNCCIKKDNIIFFEGQGVQSVNILLQGSLDVYISPSGKHEGMNEDEIMSKSYKLFSIGQNIFLGTSDLYLSGKYAFTYTASQDSNLYSYPALSPEQVRTLISSQKDYAAYIVTSLSSLIKSSVCAMNGLRELVYNLKSLTDNLTAYFWALKDKSGLTYTPSGCSFRSGLENLSRLTDAGISIPFDFSQDFLEGDYSKIYNPHTPSTHQFISEKADYYMLVSSIPADVRKSYFGSSVRISDYHIRDASKVLEDVQRKIKQLLVDLEKYLSMLYSENDECIFIEYVRAVSEADAGMYEVDVLIQCIDFIASKIKEYDCLLDSTYCHKINIDYVYLECLCNQAKSSVKTLYSQKSGALPEMGESFDSIPEELRDSAEKILAYSDIPKDRADMFMANLKAFRTLKDKLSGSEEARKIRTAATPVFFEIYEAVFKKTAAENSCSKLLDMFLTFAYMDDKLLDPRHILTLYKFAGKTKESSPCRVYNAKEWLNSIYAMENDPSINEFGQDYFDGFRELKRRKEVTDKDRYEYEHNTDKRINYEINNMLRVNQRLCHGQISVYYPVLHNEMISKDLEKALLTPELINESVNRLLETDFSAFHREISYRNAEKGIEKELIMKAFAPDFILMPTFGTRSIMWQELSGRNRSSSGRFILPLFTSENLDDIIIKLTGNFRWELCRTMMGVSWNDVSQKSLTSEYTDYIQFYKKNKDLTEEAKEKVKAQTQKYRNMMRDIFTSDYALWINYESKGVIRLNKVARSIFYKYCPFSKPIREYLEKQPLYAEIAAQFNRSRMKYVRELENHYNKTYRNGELDEEFVQNLRFYKEL